MTSRDLNKLTQHIVAQARKLSAARTTEGDAPVNYACVFAQSQVEYAELVAAAGQLGVVADETAMGPVFHISPLDTEAGTLRLLKIRRPDSKRTERGDADFTVSDYPAFKRTYVGKKGFDLIEREQMEMIELIDPSFDVLVYYSNPPLADVLEIPPDPRT